MLFFHDIKTFYYPVWLAGQKIIAQGYIPLWSRHASFGFPILAESQCGLLNPLGILLFYVFSPVFAFNILMISAVFLALSGSYAFFREMDLSRSISIFLSTTYGFSGFFIYHLMHININLPASCLPWTLFFALRLIRRAEGRYASFILLSLTVAFQILSGTFQYALYNLLFCVFFIMIIEPGSLKGKKNFIICLALASGLLLASLQLFSTIELVSLSERQKGLDRDEIAQKSYPPFNLITYLYPYSFGIQTPADARGYGFRTPAYYGPGAYWEINSYMGVSSIVLLLCLFISIFNKDFRYRKAVLPLAFLLLIVYIAMLGKYSPFFGLLAELPVISYFRGFSRLLYIFNLIILLLCGYSLKSLGKSKSGIRCILLVLIMLVVFHLSAGLFFGCLVQKNPHGFSRILSDISGFNLLNNPFFNQTLLLILFSCLCLLLIVKNPKWLLLLIIFNFIDIYNLNADYNRYTPASEALLKPGGVKALERSAGNVRIANVIRRPHPFYDLQSLKSSSSLIWGISDVFLPSPLLLVKQKAFLEKYGLLFHPFLEQEKAQKLLSSLPEIRSAGITHLVLPAWLPFDHKSFTLVFSDEHVNIYGIKNPEPIIGISPGGSAFTQYDSPHAYTVCYSLDPAFQEKEHSLKIRYMDYPGWVFYRDGEAVKPGLCRDIFLQIPLIRNSGTVKAKYLPKYYKLSLYLILLTISILILFKHLLKYIY